jgi:hypothetical protein
LLFNDHTGSCENTCSSCCVLGSEFRAGGDMGTVAHKKIKFRPHTSSGNLSVQN